MQNKWSGILLLSLLLMGCSNIEFVSTSDNNETNGGNKAPVVNAGVDKTTQVAKSIEIVGSVIVGDGDITGYEWRENTQLLSGLKSFTYTPTTEGNHTLTFTATDENDLSDSDSMVVEVTVN